MVPAPSGWLTKAVQTVRSSLLALPNACQIQVRSDAATPTEQESFTIYACAGHIAARSETDHSSRSCTYRRMDAYPCIGESRSDRLAATRSRGVTNAYNDTFATASLEQAPLLNPARLSYSMMVPANPFAAPMSNSFPR